MVNNLEAQRATHDEPFDINTQPPKVGSDEQSVQRAADKARRQAEAQVRIDAWEKRVFGHQESQAKANMLRTSNIWKPHHESLTQDFSGASNEDAEVVAIRSVKTWDSSHDNSTIESNDDESSPTKSIENESKIKKAA